MIFTTKTITLNELDSLDCNLLRNWLLLVTRTPSIKQIYAVVFCVHKLTIFLSYGVKSMTLPKLSQQQNIRTVLPISDDKHVDIDIIGYVI